MTKSGAAATAAFAIAGKGHCAGSLHAWKAFSAIFIRQPVSPSTTIVRGIAFGNGSARPAMVARTTPGGIDASQVDTGNAEGFEFAGVLNVGRSGIVPGAARTVIARATPSSSIAGHAVADVMARAIGAPSSESTTKVYNVLVAIAPSRRSGSAQPARTAAASSSGHCCH